jgi:hypothetical protein
MSAGFILNSFTNVPGINGQTVPVPVSFPGRVLVGNDLVVEGSILNNTGEIFTEAIALSNNDPTSPNAGANVELTPVAVPGTPNPTEALNVNRGVVVNGTVRAVSGNLALDSSVSPAGGLINTLNIQTGQTPPTNKSTTTIAGTANSVVPGVVLDVGPLSYPQWDNTNQYTTGDYVAYTVPSPPGQPALVYQGVGTPPVGQEPSLGAPGGNGWLKFGPSTGDGSASTGAGDGVVQLNGSLEVTGSITSLGRVYQSPVLISPLNPPTVAIDAGNLAGLLWDFSSGGSAYNALTQKPGTYLLRVSTTMTGTNSIALNGILTYPIVWDGTNIHAYPAPALLAPPYVSTSTTAGDIQGVSITCISALPPNITLSNTGFAAYLYVSFVGNAPLVPTITAQVSDVIRIA